MQGLIGDPPSWTVTASPPVHWHRLIWALYIVMLILLVCPALTFLLRGWAVRKRDILGAFTDKASHYYLLTFHPDYLESEQRTAPHGSKSTALSEMDEKGLMVKYYLEQYGRASFWPPLVLCLIAAAILLGLCTDTVIELLITGNQGLLPAEAVAAITGGYMWVVSDQIALSSRDNLSQSDLYWACFRLVLAVPLAYALSHLAPSRFAIPISFLLGTFPTKTVMTFSRSAVERWTQLGHHDLKIENPLKCLKAIDSAVADRFESEGITTIFQLANSDPVKLAIRTGMGFSYILDCCGQALLWNYAGDNIYAFQKLGIIGVYEVRSLWKKLNSRSHERQQQSKSIVTELKKSLDLSEEAMLNMLEEIAKNPNTIFQHNTWMTGLRPADQTKEREDAQTVASPE